jgi:hypothetical protein
VSVHELFENNQAMTTSAAPATTDPAGRMKASDRSSALLRREAQQLVNDVRKQLRNRKSDATAATDQWED